MLDPELDKHVPEINEITWKLIAEERLQMLVQMRDEAQAWNEAFLKERERSEKLEARLFDALGVNKTQPVEERIQIQSPAQINTRRANWPRVKRELEKHFAGSSVPDLGVELNEEDKKELEKEDYAAI